MAERFYVNCPLELGRVILQGAEAHHLATVRRLRPGQQVYLFNGDGHEYHAEIGSVGRRLVELKVLGTSVPQRELPFRLIVACPLPKGDRGQFLIEKLTELGATTFVPLRMERSVVHPGEGRMEKLQRYVIEASKQCGRNVLMRIEELVPWEQFAQRNDLPLRRLLAQAGGEALHFTGGEDTAVAVGPEGGFSPDEVELGKRAGWQVINLGPRVLRVETAALALAAALGLGAGGSANRRKGVV